MPSEVVTIGVPSYNSAASIKTCLETLAAQDFDRFKIVVSDDASVDDTCAIVEDFARSDPRVTLLRHTVNVGMIANFQSLVARCDTPYFMWRADDDWSAPNYVSALYDVLSTRDDCILAAPNVRVDREEDQSQASTPLPIELNERRADRVQQAKYLFDVFHNSWFYGLWRTEALHREYSAVLRSYAQTHGNDLLLLLAMILDGGVCGSDQTLFVHNVDSRGRKHNRKTDFGSRIKARELSWLPFLARMDDVLSEKGYTDAEIAALKPELDAFPVRNVGCNQWQFTSWQLRKLFLGR